MCECVNDKYLHCFKLDKKKEACRRYDMPLWFNYFSV